MSNSAIPVSETVLEIDLGALANNYRYLRSQVPPEVKFMAVVKAFGYGSDAVAVAKKLETLGVDYFAGAYAQEGVLLREADIRTRILVLHSLPGNFETIVENCLEPNLYSFKILSEFIAYAETKKLEAYPVHLKFNTGLNRLGFLPSDVPEICEKLKDTQSIRIASLFSHLAASEDPKEKSFSEQQIASFRAAAESMLSCVGYTPLLHMANTSGILNYPEAHFDMVRSGIGLYGFGNDPAYDQNLQPIATLKTVISQIHALSAGASIGYNRAFMASKPIRTATLPLGHADGISRIYGNGKGWVHIHGQKAPIVGNVCMDMIMVDVSDIDCKEGDEAIVLGQENRADIVAQAAGTISYELITALSQRIKRVVIEELAE